MRFNIVYKSTIKNVDGDKILTLYPTNLIHNQAINYPRKCNYDVKNNIDTLCIYLMFQ